MTLWAEFFVQKLVVSSLLGCPEPEPCNKVSYWENTQDKKLFRSARRAVTRSASYVGQREGPRDVAKNWKSALGPIALSHTNPTKLSQQERDLADKIAHIKCLHNDITDQDRCWVRLGRPVASVQSHNTTSAWKHLDLGGSWRRVCCFICTVHTDSICGGPRGMTLGLQGR